LKAGTRHVADEIYLDQRVSHQKPSRSDRCPRRRDLEVALPHLIKSGKVIEVCKKDLSLDDVVERAPCGLKRFLQIRQHEFCLQLNVRAIEGKIVSAFCLLR